MKRDNYIRTFTGKKFYPLDPSPKDVDILDIAHALAQVIRFGGHLPRPYSVGQHSVCVSIHCPPEIALWGLLHDASEAYLADVCSPVKHDPRFLFYRNAEAKVMLAVCEHFNLDPLEPIDVKVMDRRAFSTERRDLKHDPRSGYMAMDDSYSDYPPFEDQISVKPWHMVEKMFLQRYEKIKG